MPPIRVGEVLRRCEKQIIRDIRPAPGLQPLLHPEASVPSETLKDRLDDALFSLRLVEAPRIGNLLEDGLHGLAEGRGCLGSNAPPGIRSLDALIEKVLSKKCALRHAAVYRDSAAIHIT